jgi:hypothetical protein
MELVIGIGGVVVGLAGVVATVLTVYLTGKQREEERGAAERTEERRQAIAALTPVQGLLFDMNPSHFPVMASPKQAQEILVRLEKRRLSTRERLIGVRIAHRDERVRDLAEEVIKDVEAAMRSLQAMARAAFGSGEADYKTAAEDHKAAAVTAEQLRRALSHC